MKLQIDRKKKPLLQDMKGILENFTKREKEVMVTAWNIAYPEVPIDKSTLPYLSRKKVKEAVRDYCTAVVEENVRSVESGLLEKMETNDGQVH